jgi:hypothetical protein
MGIYEKLFIPSFHLGELLNLKTQKNLRRKVDKAE